MNHTLKDFERKLQELKFLPKNYEFSKIVFHTCPSCVITTYVLTDGEKYSYQTHVIDDTQIQEVITMCVPSGVKLKYMNLIMDYGLVESIVLDCEILLS